MPNLSLFPDITNIITEDVIEEIKYGREIDLTLVDGEPVVYEGIKALQIWIYKALKTARYRWLEYTWNFGSEIEYFIGLELNNAVLEREVQRVVREALISDKRISDIRDFVIQRTDNKLYVDFIVTTFLGDTLTVGGEF